MPHWMIESVPGQTFQKGTQEADSVPDSSFLALDNEAYGRACKLRNSFVMSAAFASDVPHSLCPLLRCAGGRLLNVYIVDFGIVSEGGSAAL
ncbi:hypothetical protein JTB14_018940 [Gonioctena quinquepunctata]|nr:hypothetical protein JTB14_018940 [Gonioctena quinquepunctata]